MVHSKVSEYDLNLVSISLFPLYQMAIAIVRTDLSIYSLSSFLFFQRQEGPLHIEGDDMIQSVLSVLGKG